MKRYEMEVFGCDAAMMEDEFGNYVLHSDYVDLVTKLKGYAVHDDDCAKNGWEDRVCTCGLTKLLGEME